MATTKLTDAFKSHPLHIPHNKNLDYLQKVPDSYSWIQPNSFPSAQHSDSDSDPVPLIDLSLPNAADLVRNAMKTWGVFQVINHGIPISLLESIVSSANALFSLPPPQKLKVARTPDGTSGYGVARITSFFPKRMWSEGFSIVGSPLDHFRKLWPNDYTKYCDIVEEYEASMKSLSWRLIWLALGEFGVTPEELKWGGSTSNGDFKKSHAATQFNSYPVCPDPDQAMGMGVHTDTSLLTILYQDTSGLQALREGNRWVTVEPVADALVVQVGDLLHILTNGLYPSVFHQAVVNRTRNRLSVAYFFGPPETAEISPLEKVMGPTQQPLYRTVTWSEYLGKKAEHFNNTLSSIRLCVNDHNQLNVG